MTDIQVVIRYLREHFWKPGIYCGLVEYFNPPLLRVAVKREVGETEMVINIQIHETSQ